MAVALASAATTFVAASLAAVSVKEYNKEDVWTNSFILYSIVLQFFVVVFAVCLFNSREWELKSRDKQKLDPGSDLEAGSDTNTVV